MRSYVVEYSTSESEGVETHVLAPSPDHEYPCWYWHFIRIVLDHVDDF